MKYKIADSDDMTFQKSEPLRFLRRGSSDEDKELCCITREGREADEAALSCLILSSQEFFFEEKGAGAWEELNARARGGFIDFFLRFGKPYPVSGYPQGSLYRLSQESLDFFLAAFLNASSDDPLFVLSGEEFLYTNSAFLLLTGRNASKERPLLQKDIFPDLKQAPSGRNREALRVSSSRVRCYEVHERRYRLRLFDGHALTIGAIPEGNRARLYEEQAKKSNRLETVGLLSSTIAHDLNNILGVIKGYCEILAKKESLSRKGAREVDAIRSSAEKGIRLASKILDAGKKEQRDREPVSLHHKARTAMEMMARLYPGKLVLETAFEAGHDLVLADSVEMDQVFMNLLINARDALGGEGHIRIATDNRTGATGEAIHVALSDDGPGIPDEVMPHLFDPFFTTKEHEKGSGLGLYIVKLIITGMGGTVWAGSSSEKGGVIHFLLPLAEIPRLQKR
ncbi:MAG TPA: HAMP domain-containing sensor histidine kinase [Candidatus Mcinerneyibacteriales bacterium]|nr:HAMP domain-containing sensor histidine kinase [Candidatus Mcinerneyibacteriales bacterium]